MIQKLFGLGVLFLSLVFSTSLPAENSKSMNSNLVTKVESQAPESLKWSVVFLNKILYSCNEWYLSNNQLKKPIQGVLNYAENDPLDTVVTKLHRMLIEGSSMYLIDRYPQDVRNVSDVQGYVSEADIQKEIESIKKELFDSLNNANLQVPAKILNSELQKAQVVPDGDPMLLLAKKNTLPEEFKSNLDRQLAAIQFPPSATGAATDSIIRSIFVNYRNTFNDSVLNRWRDKTTFGYRSKKINQITTDRIINYQAQIAQQNMKLLSTYNEKVVGLVNDSLRLALRFLARHADADSALVRLANLTDSKTEIWTANRDMRPIRMFLKNAQNDSISVLLLNNKKGELKLIIDDNIKLTRFTESKGRSVSFQTKALDPSLQKVNLKQVIYPPWTLNGNGSLGFTQTALSNWSKGGESTLSMLLISKYIANYSKNKVKWENSAEVRYGVSQTPSRGLEKNEDKIELQSRFGISAFKKWYYSGESNFKTQLANGYAFPNKLTPISAFMAPGFLTVSLGLDYKPSRDFSLFLSPLTSKTTYVQDTVLIAPSRYGLLPGTKKLVEPGIIVKANWHYQLSENIGYDTKGEFFNNYKYPFQKVAVEWEQVLLMQINRFITTRIMTSLIYDYNTKFPILNDQGVVIGKKPKLQAKELFTIGLTYKF